MIRKETVFVLGAGASKPYGFPTGPELRHDLVTRILATPDAATKAHQAGRAKPRIYDYYGILYKYIGDTALVDACQKALGRSWATSVDMFMTTQPPEIRKVCKAAIVLAIAEAESQEDALFFAPPSGDWFRYLWRFLHKGCKRAGDIRGNNNVSFITFNYDRTLEWSLANGIMYAFNVNQGKAFDAIPPVVHFYGDLGELRERDYGYHPQLGNLEHSVQRIQVIEENEQLTPNMELARELLRGAEQVIFLGFGYDETNMRLLGVGKELCVLPPKTLCYGTLYGLNTAEAQTAANLFARCKTADGSAHDRFTSVRLLDADAHTYLRELHPFLA